MKDKKFIALINFVAAVLLFIALAPINEYAYFEFVRWFVFCVAVFLAVFSYGEKSFKTLFIYTAIAVLFNPFARFNMGFLLWKLLDFACACIFCFYAYVNYRKNSRKK